MGQTALYKLRWPERTGGKPNGPNDYKNLASDVEDQMIRFRTRNTYDGWLDNPIIATPGETKTLTSQLVTPTIRGWVAVEYQVNIIGWTGGNFGGWIQSFIGPADGVQPLARTHRMHNEASGTMWYSTGRIAYSTLDLKPIRWYIRISNDSLSSNTMRVPFLPFAVQQYGGKPV